MINKILTQQTRFSEADNTYRVGCKTKRNSGFYLCRQDADTRNEHQDDGASHTGHVRMALQEGFRMKQRITQDA